MEGSCVHACTHERTPKVISDDVLDPPAIIIFRRTVVRGRDSLVLRRDEPFQRSIEDLEVFNVPSCEKPRHRAFIGNKVIPMVVAVFSCA